jgi:hypothetical protein
VQRERHELLAADVQQHGAVLGASDGDAVGHERRGDRAGIEAALEPAGDGPQLAEQASGLGVPVRARR